MSDETPTPGAGDYVEVLRNDAGEWFWRRKSANHLIIGDSGEGYEDKHHAVEMAARVHPGVRLKVLESPPDES